MPLYARRGPRWKVVVALGCSGRAPTTPGDPFTPSLLALLVPEHWPQIWHFFSLFFFDFFLVGKPEVPRLTIMRRKGRPQGQKSRAPYQSGCSSSHPHWMTQRVSGIGRSWVGAKRNCGPSCHVWDLEVLPGRWDHVLGLGSGASRSC
jgi:hypothetical protein